MELLPTINELKTAQTARMYLSDKFPKLVMMAGFSMIDIKSPRFSAAPITPHADNGAERNMINRINAAQLVNDTIDAIKRCTGVYQKILLLAYIQELNETAILEQIPYERSHYYELKAKALVYFADSFINTYDLHEYDTNGGAICVN